MRTALLVVAGLALIGYLAVAFVLPQREGADRREAAQALILGAEPAKQHVADHAGERRHPRLEREERARSHSSPDAAIGQGELELQGLPDHGDAGELRRSL